MGWGVLGGIPWTAVDRYAERNGVEDFEEFERMIAKLDDAFLKRVNDRVK